MFMERKNTMKMSVFQKLIYKVIKMSTTSKPLEFCEGYSKSAWQIKGEAQSGQF